MNKKETLIKLLSLIDTNDPVLHGLTTIVAEGEINETILEHFIQIFKEYQKKLTDQEAQEKIQKGIEILEKMKQVEQQSHQQDKTRLEELDDMLANI
jgi:polyhydroxyalkanoate synthesis regulator phasin